MGAPICNKDPVGAETINKDSVLMMLNNLSRDQKLIMPTTNSAYGSGDEKNFCTEESPLNPISRYAIEKVEVENRLMDFSAVQVFGTAAPGSGAIIARKNDDYYVLTAKHVIGEILKGDEIEIMTIDGNYHSAELLKIDEKIDAALIKFRSNRKYYPAFFDPNTKAISGQKSVVIGYALASKETKVTICR